MAVKSSAKFKKGHRGNGRKGTLEIMEGKNHDRRPPYSRKSRTAKPKN